MKKLQISQIQHDSELCLKKEAFSQVISFYKKLWERFRNYISYSYIPQRGRSADWVDPDIRLAIPSIIDFNYTDNSLYFFDYEGKKRTLSIWYDYKPPCNLIMNSYFGLFHSVIDFFTIIITLFSFQRAPAQTQIILIPGLPCPSLRFLFPVPFPGQNEDLHLPFLPYPAGSGLQVVFFL